MPVPRLLLNPSSRTTGERASDVAVAERRTRDISVRWCCAEGGLVSCGQTLDTSIAAPTDVSIARSA
jgi:hypothetical protein